MPNQPPRICVVGSSNMDLTFRTSRLPSPGETLAGHSFQTGFGGKGANQAVMAARLGARVCMIGKVGRDVFGEQMLRNFRDQGIDTTHVGTDADCPSGVAAIVVDDAVRNCILVIPGANLALSPQDVRQAAVAIREADVLLCQLEVPLETVREALGVAREAGVRSILNPAPIAGLLEEELRLADLCVPNETEIEKLTGRPARTLDEAAAAAQLLLASGPATVLVTLGERGVVLVDGQTRTHVPAVPVKAVDSSGAGDAFIGSLAVFLAEGLGLAEAAQRANAVAALSVTRAGTQASFPSRVEAEVFLADSLR